ncbi:LuxR C-terminal-related transcriptional regulator [Litorilinea aerophila]|uniref:AAA family ATPase n=1 Tax=Litorilinea aerophila TaxID=1204385 RepID=A0A540VEA2_9CHLR|nr:LuxR C-terminal-related transcriptional regulator [Litorilinea aerophila]
MTQWHLPDTIPLTKLRPPRLAEDILERPHLVQALQKAVANHRLTLLSAPAGAGKTIAVAALHAACPQMPMAWVALDEGDDELQAFLQLLIAAVRPHLPDFGSQAQPLLAAGRDAPPNIRRLLGLLINDFAAHLGQTEGPFLLVLEDYHRIDNPAIHSLVDYLLERMPPDLHLLLTTRHDPPLRLAHLRARGQLAEFRLDGLSFSPDEVVRLFQEELDMALSPTDVEQIHQRTGGWAAGVRLLALYLARLDTTTRRRDLLAHLAGSHHFLFDYLMEEVFNRLSGREQTFLLQTAILDELTPTACQAVTGLQDAGALLDGLYRQNLFLTLSEAADPLAEPVYRSHALFAGFLRRELHRQPGMDMAALHRRAADVASTPERHIHHLLAAADWPAAAEAIIDLGRAQCQQDFVHPRVMAWIDGLPAEARRAHYWLDLIEAGHLRQRGELSRAWELAQDAYPRAQAAGDVAGELEALWTLAFYVTEQSDPVWQTRLGELSGQHPDRLSPLRRTNLLMGKIWYALNGGHWAAAQELFHDYLRTAETAGDIRIYDAAGQFLGPQFLFLERGMELVERFDQAALHLLGEAEEGLAHAGIYMRQGWIHLLRGDLSAAATAEERTRRLQDEIGALAWMDIMLDILRLALLIARGECDALADFVRRAEVERHQIDTHRNNLYYYRVALWRGLWQQDRREELRQVQRAIEAEEDLRSIAEIKTFLALLAGWQAVAAGQPAAAETAFQAAVGHHRRIPWIGIWGNPGLDLALFYLQEGRPQDALAAWREAAREMVHRGMPGQPLWTGRKVIPLLELAVAEEVYPHVARMALDAFGVDAAPRPLPIPGSQEWLTPREVEVLRLLLEGATNRAIADALVITPRTAKAHVSNILQKLQAATRSEAAARARQLGLFG